MLQLHETFKFRPVAHTPELWQELAVFGAWELNLTSDDFTLCNMTNAITVRQTIAEYYPGIGGRE